MSRILLSCNIFYLLLRYFVLREEKTVFVLIYCELGENPKPANYMKSTDGTRKHQPLSFCSFDDYTDLQRTAEKSFFFKCLNVDGFE